MLHSPLFSSQELFLSHTHTYNTHTYTTHTQITPEVLRELDLSRDRGQHATGVAQAAHVSKVDLQVKENLNALPAVVLMEEY